MPRATVKFEHPIETLAVLDHEGNLDEALAPKIDDELLKRMYRAMVLGRQFDAQMLKLQRQGRIGTFAPIKGQEAAQIGAIATIKKDDWFIPSFRETAAAIWRGAKLEDILVLAAGFNEGQAMPKGQHDLPNCVPVASQLPHAVGIAYAIKLRQEDGVVLTFFGDGATSEGDFHEALNFASVLKVPVVFVCQNNHWAISVPLEDQTKSRTLAQKAVAYGMPGIQVDGNDILAVYQATKEAVERARNDNMPTLIECTTYRMGVHTTADDPSVYRDEEDVEAWKDKDPIDRFKRHLKDQGLLDDDALKDIDEDIGAEVKKAWKKAEKRIETFDDDTVIFNHVYAELTPALKAQRENFKERRHG